MQTSCRHIGAADCFNLLNAVLEVWQKKQLVILEKQENNEVKRKRPTFSSSYLIKLTDDIIENAEVLQAVTRLCRLHVEFEKVRYSCKEHCTAAVRLVVQGANLLRVGKEAIGYVNGQNVLQQQLIDLSHQLRLGSLHRQLAAPQKVQSTDVLNLAVQHVEHQVDDEEVLQVGEGGREEVEVRGQRGGGAAGTGATAAVHRRLTVDGAKDGTGGEVCVQADGQQTGRGEGKLEPEVDANEERYGGEGQCARVGVVPRLTKTKMKTG